MHVNRVKQLKLNFEPKKSENIKSKNLPLAHSVTARKKLFENVLVNDNKQQRGQNPK